MKDNIKKILMALVCTIALCSCTTQVREEKVVSTDTKKIEIIGDWYCLRCELVDVTIDNETHQYIIGDHKICHWEGCKYCKKH